jgi:hypothetical protein
LAGWPSQPGLECYFWKTSACIVFMIFLDCIHMAGPTRLQSGLKIRLQCMLENMQQFHFTANNIPENPASRACLDWFVRRGGSFPEVVHYYRGQGAFSLRTFFKFEALKCHTQDIGNAQQFVKHFTFYLIKSNYIHCFVVYINILYLNSVPILSQRHLRNNQGFCII